MSKFSGIDRRRAERVRTSINPGVCALTGLSPVNWGRHEADNGMHSIGRQVSATGRSQRHYTVLACMEATAEEQREETERGEDTREGGINIKRGKGIRLLPRPGAQPKAHPAGSPAGARGMASVGFGFFHYAAAVVVECGEGVNSVECPLLGCQSIQPPINDTRETMTTIRWTTRYRYPHESARGSEAGSQIAQTHTHTPTVPQSRSPCSNHGPSTRSRTHPQPLELERFIDLGEADPDVVVDMERRVGEGDGVGSLGTCCACCSHFRRVRPRGGGAAALVGVLGVKGYAPVVGVGAPDREGGGWECEEAGEPGSWVFRLWWFWLCWDWCDGLGCEMCEMEWREERDCGTPGKPG
ncbi:hypothetical protein IMY05_C1295000300 [Salix suchowensis]|nr:hypothetical protein IMY05_C1295000300 [Salix suchowensis]